MTGVTRTPSSLRSSCGEARENPLVDLVVAESRLVFFEAEAPQPDPTSMTAPTISGGVHHPLAYGECPGWRWFWPAGRTRPSKMEDELMKSVILTALITCLAVGTATAQSCDSKAVSANGKPLHGAAKMSFVKKCKRDACGSKAVSAEGKPLHGAAKNSFMTKCMRAA